MEVVLVRHGQTDWSLSGRHTGRTDIPLTDEGRRNAEAIGSRLSSRAFERVLTSPLSRAADTCTLAGFGESAQPREELLEWDYGEYEGRTTREIREERPDWYLWRDGSSGGETAAAVGARADRLIAELRKLDGDAVLFGHGHALRAIGARWVDLAAEEGGRLVLDTAAVCVLGWEREIPVIRLWNDTLHVAA